MESLLDRIIIISLQQSTTGHNPPQQHLIQFFATFIQLLSITHKNRRSNKPKKNPQKMIIWDKQKQKKTWRFYRLLTCYNQCQQVNKLLLVQAPAFFFRPFLDKGYFFKERVLFLGRGNRFEIISNRLPPIPGLLRHICFSSIS